VRRTISISHAQYGGIAMTRFLAWLDKSALANPHFLQMFQL
jgi:hypothetical protein